MAGSRLRLSKQQEKEWIEAGVLRPVHKSFGPLYKEDMLKPKTKKQRESVLQREIIKVLHDNQLGFFFRVRNGATFDVARGRYRSNTTVPGISDICGHAANARAAYIEVKYQKTRRKNEDTRVYKTKLSSDQIEFLINAEKDGCLAGVAYNAADAVAIIQNDQSLFPRHPRTYEYKSHEWRVAYMPTYRSLVSELAKKKKDPLWRDVMRLVKSPDKEAA